MNSLSMAGHIPKGFIIHLLLMTFLLIFTPALQAQEQKAGFQMPLAEDFTIKKRKILGIYSYKKSDEGVVYNPIQNFAHVILNHAGYIVKLHNINQDPLPTPEEMKEFAGVLSWFNTQSIPNPDKYVIWMEQQAKAGKKIILVGQTGVEVDKKTGETLGPGLKIRLMSLVGLEYRGNFKLASTKVKLVNYDKEMIGFEYMPTAPVSDYEWYVPRNENVKTWAAIEHEDLPESESSVVTSSPNGGYIRQSFSVFSESSPPYRSRWIINPFLFFKEIFPAVFPIPDPTTKNGKRVFFSHLDGDAFHSPSRADLSKLSSEMIEEILKQFKTIPVGISFVIAEIDPKAMGKKKHIEIARRIAALPNVELGSHTYNHPYKWRGEDRTLAYYPPYIEKNKTNYDYEKKDKGHKHKIKKQPFDYNYEILESTRYINQNIAPAGKEVVAIYWTGDTNPPPLAFDILEKNRLLNINGGDSIMDPHVPSYTNTSPYVRSSGKHWQVLSSQSNENLFTNLWKEDFNGLENLLLTFKNTDSPKRIAAANCYYHFYSGERISSIKALKKIYTWAFHNELSMVFPSEYMKMVKGFLSTEIVVLDSERFQIINRGDLNNFRVDAGSVDIDGSAGVTGISEHNGSTYISLDPKVPFPIIQLD